MRILVTGATGFVGTHVVAHLRKSGHEVVLGVRRSQMSETAAAVSVVSSDSGQDELHRAVNGVEAVVHLAARVHVMHDTAVDPSAEFEKVNTAWTDRLAMAAKSAGVRRFVFLSSIKVNGESTRDHPFSATDDVDPRDPYGRSKWLAEQALSRLADDYFRVVVLRTPLVYGPGVGGNFVRLLGLVRSGIPLPLGGISNRRTMTSISNLVDAILYSIEAPLGDYTLALVADGESYSTPGLLREIALASRRPSRVFWFPFGPIDTAARLVGRGEVTRRLSESLEVTPGSSSQSWSWRPAQPPVGEIERTVMWHAHAGEGKQQS